MKIKEAQDYDPEHWEESEQVRLAVLREIEQLYIRFHIIPEVFELWQETLTPVEGKGPIYLLRGWSWNEGMITELCSRENTVYPDLKFWVEKSKYQINFHKDHMEILDSHSSYQPLPKGEKQCHTKT